MPDDRSMGYMSGGYVRFSSSDNSGSVAGIPDKKRSRDQSQEPDKDKDDENKKEEINSSEFVDRSAQLSASLNSLAMLNVSVLNLANSKDKSHGKFPNLPTKTN